MTVEYLDLADYVAIAAEVTGLHAATIMKAANLDLADSALHAPAAAFGETEFYPAFVDKTALLILRLAKNHPLPDGNKRAAWVRQLRGRFLDGMIENEVVLDLLLCEFLRIHPDLFDLVRSTLLAGPSRSKITALEAFLNDEGLDGGGIINRLESLAKLRDIFAHAQVTRPGGFGPAEQLVFVRYRSGRIQKNNYTEDELQGWMKQSSDLWNELGALREALIQHCKGTTYLHVVSPSGGQQNWDTRPAQWEDVPAVFRDAYFGQTGSGARDSGTSGGGE